MSTEERNWDLEAAEYVLGTLSDEERLVYDKLYEVDHDWQQRVHRWQSRLDPLHATTPPVEPPAHVLKAIMERINYEASSGSTSTTDKQTPLINADRVEALRQPATSLQYEQGSQTSAVAATSVSSSSVVSLKQWRERVRYWQLATLLAVASLAGVIILGPGYLARQQLSPEMGRTVAVLQNELNEPLWTISYRPTAGAGQGELNDGGIVSVTVVGAPVLTDAQSHQLWMVLPEGAGVQSVGLVPNETGETTTFELPIPLEAAAEFAVSLEPLGGVPGPEHGPVVTRTFIVQTPSETGV